MAEMPPKSPYYKYDWCLEENSMTGQWTGVSRETSTMKRSRQTTNEKEKTSEHADTLCKQKLNEIPSIEESTLKEKEEHEELRKLQGK
jgi:hypothetical protein